MPYENIYIQKVAEHTHILSDEERMHAKKGQWKEFFGKEKLMLEIGTGMGNFFSNYAENNPDTACVGIELKFKRLIRTYEKCARKGREDVILLKVFGQKIPEIFAPGEIDELYLLFSDPWPKKGHHKNRVIQDDFLRDAASVLVPGGLFLIKTDEASYAEWIDEHLARCPHFTYKKNDNEEPDKKLTPENATEFETMGRREGSKIVSFICRKKK
ncbi:tRNA (guanosine(46)-N7)-methyltransferase TrmB [Candidatus Gracilibacteria bacterium]|nr:tRNA (guanosine(46)-N7)-methyltransferase TrmB [Candidatus Gracilibacteria bacterium]